MTLPKNVSDLLSQLPGWHKELEVVRFLKDPKSFYREIPKTDAEIEQDATRLRAKHPELAPTKAKARKMVPTTRVEMVRPEWLGPEPTIKLLSEVPIASRDAFEFAVTHELIDVYWGAKGDAHLYVSDKGRAAVAESRLPDTNPPDAVPMLERVLAALTPNQGRIMQYLLDKKTASFDTLRNIPRAWRDVPSDEAVKKALRDMKSRLEAANLQVGYIAISAAKQRVTLTDG